MVEYFEARQGLDFEKERFVNLLFQLITAKREETGKQGILIVCIGTDRCLGDTFGPLVGHLLKGRNNIKHYSVVGTLDCPVHAINLAMYRECVIAREYSDYLIIAVDSSIGSIDHQCNIAVINGGIEPGKGTGKDLGIIGDISITGIVNSTESNMLTTRLSSTMRLAECTVDALSALDQLLELTQREIASTVD